MKRHEALQPLSREHHEGLILARLLQKDAPHYKGLPQTLQDKAMYAKDFFNEKLKHHFVKEEKIFNIIKPMQYSFNLLINEITEEHLLLFGLINSLENSTSLSDDLDKLGKTLEQHIRKEERFLFPLIEQHCSDDIFHQIQKLKMSE